LWIIIISLNKDFSYSEDYSSGQNFIEKTSHQYIFFIIFALDGFELKKFFNTRQIVELPYFLILIRKISSKIIIFHQNLT